MVRLALIGAGNHCRGNHAPALGKYAADHPDRLELVAVCDLVREKAEAFAKEYGFKSVYTDHVEMIEKEKPDGCVCVMPVPLIVGLATDLMRRGMPVTVEKPPGASLEEARELLTVAKETGTPHMVSVNRRFEPFLREGLEWARAQGPLRYVRASILRHNRREPEFIFSTGIHLVDALREIGGDVADYRVQMHAGEPNWYHISLTYESSAIGCLDAMPTDGSVEERYEIYGENYRVDARVGPSPDPRLRCWKHNQIVLDKRPAPGEPDFVRVGPYAEAHEFVTALSEGRPPWPTMADVFPSMEMAYQLYPEARPAER